MSNSLAYRSVLPSTLLWITAGLLLPGLCGCTDGATDPATAEADAGTSRGDAGTSSSPMPELQIGVGEFRFIPLADDQVVPLTRGHQGLQHIWASVRFRGLPVERPILELSLERIRDGARITDDYRARLPFELNADGEWAERAGIQLVIPSPGNAIGEDLLLSASVEVGDADPAAAQVRIHMVWADEL